MDARAAGRWAFALSGAAFAWAAVLVAGAFLVPVYSSTFSGTSASGTSSGTASTTLVEENGLAALVPLAIPTVLAALVSFALHRKCSRHGRRSGQVAWIAIGLLGILALLSAASVGMFVLPVAVLLAAAAALTPEA